MSHLSGLQNRKINVDQAVMDCRGFVIGSMHIPVGFVVLRPACVCLRVVMAAGFVELCAAGDDVP